MDLSLVTKLVKQDFAHPYTYLQKEVTVQTNIFLECVFCTFRISQ